jgi:hypothetical protein
LVTKKRSSDSNEEKNREIENEKKKTIYLRRLVVITQKLSVDNVWPSFNGLTGHPTVTSLSAV